MCRILGKLFLLRSFGFIVVICLMCNSNPLGLGVVSLGVIATRLSSPPASSAEVELTVGG